MRKYWYKWIEISCRLGGSMMISDLRDMFPDCSEKEIEDMVEKIRKRKN
jgi:hypothetical protein